MTLPGDGAALASGVFSSGLSWALRRPAHPRRAFVLRDREGKGEDVGADVGSVEGRKSTGRAREAGGQGGLSPPGIYF